VKNNLNIAIDFGTSNTLVGVFDETTEKIEVLDFKDISRSYGEFSVIPSMITYTEKGKILIGEEARKNFDEIRTFSRMKMYFSKFLPLRRKINGKLLDERQAAKDFLYEVIRLTLERIPRTQIRNITLTAPVESFDLFRMFLGEIAQDFNLSNWKVIDEPTAVALGYKVVISPDYPYCIIDFGGGTLDINIVRVSNIEEENSSKVAIVGIAGLDFGGEDIDKVLSDVVKAKHKLENITGLQDALEHVKITLSKEDNATINFQNISQDININQFNNIIKDLLDFERKIQDTLDLAIDLAAERGTGKRRIEKVLLVGGSSQNRFFQEIIERNFPREKISSTGNVFTSIVTGACYYLSDLIVEDFSNHDYAIEHFVRKRDMHDYETIVPKGTKFPMERVRVLTIATSQNFQDQIDLRFVEIQSNLFKEERITSINFDESGKMKFERETIGKDKKVTYLGEPLKIKLQPPGMRGEERIHLEFAIDENQILLVTAIDLKNNEKYYNRHPVVKIK